MSWNDDRENYLYIDKKPCPACGGDYAMVYEPYENKNGSRICGFVCVDCGHAEIKDSQQLFALYTGKNKTGVWDLDNDYDISDFHPDAQRVIRDMKAGRYFKPPKPKKSEKPKPKPQVQKPVYQQPKPTRKTVYYQPPQEVIRRPFIDYDVDECGNTTDFTRDYESGNFRKTVSNYKNKRAKGFQLEAYEQFRLAYSLGEIGQHHEAVKEWTTYIVLFPNNSDLATVYNNRGVEYSNINEINKSTEDYKMAVKLGYSESEKLRKIINNREASGMLDTAKSYYTNKDYKNAADLYEKSMANGYTLGANWFEYGYCLNEIKKHDEAAKAYSEYIELYPGTAAAYHNRGNIYWNKGLYKKAYEDYTNAWSLYDQENKNKFNFIKVRISAYAALEKAVKLFSEKNFSESIDNLEIFKKEGKLEGTYLFKYAYSLQEVGRSDDSVAAYSDYIANKNTDLPAASHNRGIIYWNTGKYKEAYDDYKFAWDKYDQEKRDKYVFLNEKIIAYESLKKANQLYNEKNYSEAVENFERFKKEGDLGVYLFSYAYSLFELGKIDNSIDAYTKFIDKNPESNDIPAAYNNRAVCQFKLGKHNEGFNDYWKAYSKYSADVKKNTVLSRIYSRAKQCNNFEQFEKAFLEQRVRGISDEVDAGKFYTNEKRYGKAMECFEKSYTSEAAELLDICRKVRFKEKLSADMDDFFILM